MASVDLNADLGEGVGDDAAIFPLVSSANIACGFHAGDATTMAASLRLAREHAVSVGAHPSYRDRENFGRAPMEIGPDALRADLEEQLTALAEAAVGAMVELSYLKPHGALYNRIAIDDAQADVVARVAADADLPLLGLPESAIERAAERRGVRFVREAFADRGYLPDGTLAPRDAAGGVLHDTDLVAARAVRIATEGRVDAVDGSTVVVDVASLCLHGDTPGAVELAHAVRAALAGAGVELRAFA